MTNTPRDRVPVDAETWRRVGAVMDRVHGVDLTMHQDALRAACEAEDVRVEIVKPFLTADRASDRLPERLDPTVLAEALTAFEAATDTPALAPGDRLGPYEVVSPLGAGGMGEVYTARDTRLGRTVAIKVLPSGVAADPERRRRFEREARAISRLNHPHVCALYDIGHEQRHSATESSDAHIDFLIMECVQGETLAARLARGSLTVREAVHQAAEIAEALAAAHAEGIVHRDLKPANVMLTPHGVKLLDFGLATLRAPLPADAIAGDAALTTKGAILGTLDYMAPEQLQGKAIDERADIFALGAILYEMITGRKAFDSDTPAGVIAAVLDRVPEPLSSERSDIPPALEWTVNRCLEKDPDRRWHSAADLGSHLRWIESSSLVRKEPSPKPWSRRRMVALIAGTTALAIAAIAAAVFVGARSRLSDAPPFRFAIAPPEGTSYELFAISPDARRLAFTVLDDRGARALWIRPFDALAAQRIEGTDEARYPFWSPDGRFVAFFARNKLKKLELATGNVQTICDAGSGGGGTWNADGVIVFGWHGFTPPTALYRVSAAGGIPAPITQVAPLELDISPHFLPDGRHYVYTRIAVGQPSGLFAGRLDSDERTPLLATVLPKGKVAGELVPELTVVSGRAVYASGYLFYTRVSARDRALMAQPFDVARLRLTGEPVRLADDVAQNAPGRSAFDVSASGVLAYHETARTAISQLTWFDRSGHDAGHVGDPGPYHGFELSPDGRQLLLAQVAGPMLRLDVTQGTSTPIVRGGQGPVWSPDGSRFAYRGPAVPNVRVASADGSDPRGQTISVPPNSLPGDWSADGRSIVGTAFRSETSSYDIWAIRLESGAVTFPVASADDELDPRLSPNGEWLAYSAMNASRHWDVYVRAFDQGGHVLRVGSGRHPRWGAGGRELVYLSPDGTLRQVALESGTSLRVAASGVLFRQPTASEGFEGPLTASPYDLTPDGTRLLVRVPLEPARPAPITVLLNWPSLVKR